MKRVVSSVALLAFWGLGTQPLAAQSDNAVRGTVTDAATGAPVTGAVVTLDPGGRGAVTDASGTYLIRQIRAGTYRATVRAIGFTPLSKDSVQVGGNATVVLDFKLQRPKVTLPGIVVQSRVDPELDPRVTATTQTITGEELRNLPVTTLQEAVQLQAGVVGNSFRGGRVGEQTLIVDGMGVKNQLDAASGNVGLQIPTAALEEADVVTNGFSAQYGQALSGMINVVTRDGPEHFDANVDYETDRPMGNGADYGLDRLVTTIGGPLFGGIRFLTVLDAQARLDDAPVNAPAPSDTLDPRYAEPWLLPHAAGEQYNLFGKLTIPLGAGNSLRLMGVGSAHQQLLFDPQLKYAPLQAPGQSITGKLGLAHFQHASRPDSTNATIIDLRIGYFDKSAIRAPLVSQPDYRFGAFTFSGFDFAGADIARSGDSAAAAGAIPGFGTPTFTPNTPWGVPAFFTSASPRGELIWNRFREGRARLDLFFGRGPSTDFRVGGEYVRQRVQTFTRLQAYLPVADSGQAPVVSEFSPFAAAGYGEWTQRLSDLTMVLGLRVDAFSGRADTGTAAIGGTHVAVSPRFGVSTTLADATVTASYGRFAQAPDFQYLVNAAFDDTLRTGRTRRGNPNLGFETSTQYELRVRYRTSARTVLTIGAYVKRLDGLVASVPVGLNPDSAIFGNADYGDVRGMDVTFEREFDGVVGARLTYTLQSATATATNALDFYRRLRISPVGDTVYPANVTYPLDYDRRHSITVVLQGRVPDGAPAAVRDFRAGVVGQWGSALPYSPTNFSGDSLTGLPNSKRMSPEWTIDARLSRRLTLFGIGTEFYVDVRNLTNRRNIVAVRRDTGSPQAGDVQIVQLAQQAYAANPNPIPYESPRYRRWADLNDDGLIAGTSELLPLYERAAQDFLQPIFAYGPPRLVRLGAALDF